MNQWDKSCCLVKINLDTPSGTSSIAETDVTNQVNTKNNTKHINILEMLCSSLIISTLLLN